MTVPALVLGAFGFTANRVEPVSGGLINATYVIKSGNTPLAALQRLHPVFGAAVNLDIERITEALVARKMVTPRLLRTQQGDAWFSHGDHVWRATTWVVGQCFAAMPGPAAAQSAAKLVGRFHTALADFDHEFQFVRPGAHDTAAHLVSLAEATMAPAPMSDMEDVYSDCHVLRDAILTSAEQLAPLPILPMRICHGDLKISNLLFKPDGADLQGLCLVDLDTMSHQSIAYELGDALRSWGNRDGEDTSSPAMDHSIVAAAALGYSQGASGLLSSEEQDAIIPGLATICLELAARFSLDTFRDSYFGWDSKRFSSRRHHNLLRARGQLALHQSIQAEKATLERLWLKPFRA